MTNRTHRFIGGPLDGKELPAPARGRCSIYLDDDGARLAPAKANPRKRGFYAHQSLQNEDIYQHSTVPAFAPQHVSRIAGETGWSMRVTDGSFWDKISEPTWDTDEERWIARLLVEEQRGERWVWAPIGRLVYPTAVDRILQHR